jgi:hypothetical protein
METRVALLAIIVEKPENTDNRFLVRIPEYKDF